MPTKSFTNLPPRFRRSTGGCEKCRTRHVRCDKIEPSCGQCLKRGFQCPGYQPKQWKWLAGLPPGCSRREQSKTKPPHCHRRPSLISTSKQTGNASDIFIQKSDTVIPRARTSLSSFNTEITVNCREDVFLDHYFTYTARILSMADGPDNPFGENLRPYMSRSSALKSTIIAIGAMHMAHGISSSEIMAYAWYYRTLALADLQRDLNKQSGFVELLATTLFLGMSESWFDEKSCSTLHLDAAKRLILGALQCGDKVPSFLIHCLCWLETLDSFVSDSNGLVYSSPYTYVLLAKGTHQDHFKHGHQGGEEREDELDFDPLVGSWGTLMPHIGRLGTIVRMIRTQTQTTDVENLLETVEVDLLQWEASQTCHNFSTLEPLSQSDPMLVNLNYCADLGDNFNASVAATGSRTNDDAEGLAEAYRLSALLTLYNYSPHLLAKRYNLITETITAPEFLLQIAESVMDILKRIPLDSGLWHVSSIPILTAGQLVTEIQSRDFIRSVLHMLTNKIKIQSVGKVVQILEEVWSRRDAGADVWWMDILDEIGSQLLVN